MAVDEGYPAPRVPDGVRRIVDIAYRDTAAARDRRAWLLDVVAPSDASNSLRPIVVFAHGGGLNAGAKDDETQVNSNLAIALAQQGYLVLNINHRLASEAPHPAQAQDMAAAVCWAMGAHTAEILSGSCSAVFLQEVIWPRCWRAILIICETPGLHTSASAPCSQSPPSST
jgi:acetyl esterase/lipase